MPDADEQNATRYHDVELPRSAEPDAPPTRFRLWLPPGAGPVACLLVINQRGAGRRLFYGDVAWRELAARHQAGLLYCEFEAPEVHDSGYGLDLLRACDALAETLDRPELRHAPFVLWGHSMGGRVAQDFANYASDRVLAYLIATRAYPSDAAFMRESSAAQHIPALYLMAEHDTTPADIRQHYLAARAAGAPRAWVPLPGQSHWPRGMSFTQDEVTPADWAAWTANALVLPWLDAIIPGRLPPGTAAVTGPVPLRPLALDTGWLGDDTTGQVHPWPDYPGERHTAAWLPTAPTAHLWSRQFG